MCYFTREPSITYALVKTLEKKKKIPCYDWTDATIQMYINKTPLLLSDTSIYDLIAKNNYVTQRKQG